MKVVNSDKFKGGGENNEEVNESIDRIRIIGWYLLYSKMVEKIFKKEREVKTMKKLMRVLIVLGSLVGICSTVRW
ncbi:MAG: hypothetical protein PHN32_04850 [Actinomycetota bacterium]|nr:hypothetical protein [Actinomycetota bacterium]